MRLAAARQNRPNSARVHLGVGKRRRGLGIRGGGLTRCVVGNNEDLSINNMCTCKCWQMWACIHAYTNFKHMITHTLQFEPICRHSQRRPRSSAARISSRKKSEGTEVNAIRCHKIQWVRPKQVRILYLYSNYLSMHQQPLPVQHVGAGIKESPRVAQL